MQFSPYQKPIQEPSVPSYASKPKFLYLPFQTSAQHPMGMCLGCGEVKDFLDGWKVEVVCKSLPSEQVHKSEATSNSFHL